MKGEAGEEVVLGVGRGGEVVQQSSELMPSASSLGVMLGAASISVSGEQQSSCDIASGLAGGEVFNAV